METVNRTLAVRQGGALVTHFAYDPLRGMVTEIKTMKRSTFLQNLNYSYDNFGNLASRKDNTLDMEETFAYDNLDRLTEVWTGSVRTRHMFYDGYGRMTSKTAGGQAVFTTANNSFSMADKPHALKSAEVPTGLFPSATQTVGYTGFDKVWKIKQGSDSLVYTYVHDRQRISMEERVGNTTRTKRYVGNCELVTESDGNSSSTHWLTYLTGPTGVYAVVVTQNGTNEIHYILKDNLGSWTAIANRSGVVEQRLSYDAWGNLRDPNTWSGNFSGTPMFDRGFTGHEHLYDFGLINMNGRMYDPVMSGFLSVDQYVQSPGNSQNFNRYAYCLNNPLRYVDPDGEEFLTSAIIIGSLLVGAYSGGVLTNGGEYNPIKWDWSSSNTYDGMLLGGVFGGLSGFAGVSIAGIGFAFCNTASIAASSLIYSTGMHWTGKCTNFDYGISLGIGVASFDFTHGDFGYLGKKGNSLLQDIGYGIGALANLQDFVAGFNGTKIQVKSRKELARHSELGEYSNNGIYQDGDILVSVGPYVRFGSEDQAVIQAMRNKMSFAANDGVAWELPFAKATLTGNSVSGINIPMIQPNDPQFVTTLNNVNGKLLHKMTNK